MAEQGSECAARSHLGWRAEFRADTRQFIRASRYTTIYSCFPIPDNLFVLWDTRQNCRLSDTRQFIRALKYQTILSGIGLIFGMVFAVGAECDLAAQFDR